MAEKKAGTKKVGNTALDAVMSQIRKEFGEMAIVIGVVIDGAGRGFATCKKPAFVWPVAVE